MSTQQRDVIEFQTNIFQEFSLKYASGKEVASSRPDQGRRLMFSLSDGRVMFLGERDASKLDALQPKPGERLEAARVEKREGVRKWVEFEIRRIDPPVSSQLERELQASIKKVEQQRTAPAPAGHAASAPPQAAPKPAPSSPPPTPTPPTAAAAAPVNGKAHTDWVARAEEALRRPAQTKANDNGAPAQPPAARNGSAPPNGTTHLNGSNGAAKPIPQKIPFDKAMLHFLLVAGRATKEAEKILGSEGGSVRFDSRDVAALATTLLIRAGDQGWLTWDGGAQ